MWDWLRNWRKPKEPQDIVYLSKKETEKRMCYLDLYNSEVGHSMFVESYLLDEKRIGQRSRIYC